MDGIIIIKKEVNMTSNDVVIKLKRILKPTKIGHTGTLDPNVTGVLPICLGKATKLVDMMMNDHKIYEAEVTLGIKTETEDIWGKVIEERDVLKLDEVDEVLKSFLGDYNQVPPMYSALKHNGKRLYEYARQNIEIKREPRLMHIYDIKMLGNVNYIDNKAVFSFLVEGSKGLYVRTLCTDIAQRLNTIGTMSNLKRIQTGKFNIKDSYTINDVKEGNYKIISILDYFDCLEEIEVSEYMMKMVKNGILLDERQITTSKPFKVMYDNDVIAIYVDNKAGKYAPLIIF